MSQAVPKWITQVKHTAKRKRWTGYWEKPWTIPLDAERAKSFKKELWDRGQLSPNFSRASAKSGDGQAIPSELRRRAQRHAFALERVRHDIGDKPMNPLSWYRSPAHNAAVDGATASRHMKGDATDWDASERARLGGEKFDKAMERHTTGHGYNPGRVIRHGDNGPRREWFYS